MYIRTRKADLPAGTFIPMPARVFAILQLCIAFTVLAWYASQPFMGELFAIRSHQYLFQYIMGKDNIDHAKRFESLPEAQKESIIKSYEKLLQHTERPFLNKLEESFRILALGVPPYEQAWLLFSILISVLLLKKAEGARQAIWLLPILTALYAFDNLQHGAEIEDPDKTLFPTEQYLVTYYIGHPLSRPILAQQQELIAGWKKYLVVEWAKEEPSKEKELYQAQVDRGEFAFNLNRLEHLMQKNNPEASRVSFRKSPLVLALYFLWNLLFSIVVTRRIAKPSGTKAA